MSDNKNNQQDTQAPNGNGPEFKVVDPLALYKQMYFMAEDSWAKVASAVVASDAFSEFLGKFLDNYLNMEKASNRYIDKYLETLHVPTRDDLARLANQVINVESKIDSIDERLDDVLDQLGTVPAAATKQSDSADVESLSIRVDELTEKVEEILAVVKGAAPAKKVAAKKPTE